MTTDYMCTRVGQHDSTGHSSSNKTGMGKTRFSLSEQDPDGQIMRESSVRREPVHILGKPIIFAYTIARKKEKEITIHNLDTRDSKQSTSH